MPTLKEVMFNYFSGKNIIFERFDCDGWEAIEDQTDKRWLHDGEGIQFLDDEGMEYYLEFAKKCGKTIEGIELYYIQDNGEKFYSLFTELLKLNEDEFDEEIGKEI